MAVLSAAQTLDGASDSTHSHAGGIASVAVNPSVEANDGWYVGVQMSIDSGTTWKNVDLYVRAANADKQHGFLVPDGGAEIRTITNGLNGSTLNIQVI